VRLEVDACHTQEHLASENQEGKPKHVCLKFKLSEVAPYELVHVLSCRHSVTYINLLNIIHGDGGVTIMHGDRGVIFLPENRRDFFTYGNRGNFFNPWDR